MGAKQGQHVDKSSTGIPLSPEGKQMALSEAAFRAISDVASSLSDFSWLRLKKLTYLDAKGNQRKWEVAERSHRAGYQVEPPRDNAADVVILCATIVYPVSAKPCELLLVKQFRPPVNTDVVEFVGGLCGEAESAEACARRELFEEVGFQAGVVVRHVSERCMAVDAGLCSTKAMLVFADIDGDLPDNQTLHSCPEEDEHIDVLRVPFGDLELRLTELESQGAMVGNMVWSYLHGLIGRGLVAVKTQPLFSCNSHHDQHQQRQRHLSQASLDPPPPPPGQLHLSPRLSSHLSSSQNLPDTPPPTPLLPEGAVPPFPLPLSLPLSTPPASVSPSPQHPRPPLDPLLAAAPSVSFSSWASSSPSSALSPSSAFRSPANNLFSKESMIENKEHSEQLNPSLRCFVAVEKEGVDVPEMCLQLSLSPGDGGGDADLKFGSTNLILSPRELTTSDDDESDNEADDDNRAEEELMEAARACAFLDKSSESDDEVEDDDDIEENDDGVSDVSIGILDVQDETLNVVLTQSETSLSRSNEDHNIHKDENNSGDAFKSIDGAVGAAVAAVEEQRQQQRDVALSQVQFQQQQSQRWLHHQQQDKQPRKRAKQYTPPILASSSVCGHSPLRRNPRVIFSPNCHSQSGSGDGDGGDDLLKELPILVPDLRETLHAAEVLEEKEKDKLCREREERRKRRLEEEEEEETMAQKLEEGLVGDECAAIAASAAFDIRNKASPPLPCHDTQTAEQERQTAPVASSASTRRWRQRSASLGSAAHNKSRALCFSRGLELDLSPLPPWPCLLSPHLSAEAAVGGSQAAVVREDTVRRGEEEFVTMISTTAESSCTVTSSASGTGIGDNDGSDRGCGGVRMTFHNGVHFATAEPPLLSSGHHEASHYRDGEHTQTGHVDEYDYPSTRQQQNEATSKSVASDDMASSQPQAEGQGSQRRQRFWSYDEQYKSKQLALQASQLALQQERRERELWRSLQAVRKRLDKADMERNAAQDALDDEYGRRKVAVGIAAVVVGLLFLTLAFKQTQRSTNRLSP